MKNGTNYGLNVNLNKNSYTKILLRRCQFDRLNESEQSE